MKDIAASIRARLLNLSRETRQPLESLMEHYAMGRFLYRLAGSPYRDRFILKGAQLFRIWGADHLRPTRDLDLLGYGEPTPQAIKQIFDELIGMDVETEDGLAWGEIKTGEIRANATYGGVHASIAVSLAGARLTLRIDIGFGDVITPGTHEGDWTSLPGFPSARLLTYPPETVIAEKLEAAVSLGRDNSRMKDFYDLHWLSQNQTFSKILLRQSIMATFGRRGTSLPAVIPDALTMEFSHDPRKILQWNAFIRKNSLEAPELSQVIQRLNTFLLPVLAQFQDDQKWNPETGWADIGQVRG